MNSDAETARDRRLVGDEETRLLAHAGPHLYALIVAALTTGARRRGAAVGAVGASKAHAVRHLHPGTESQNRSVKERAPRAAPESGAGHARQDPDGQQHGLEAFVFGNEVGERLTSVKTAWLATCRRAGIRDLHFHDLRRECASRWHEVGIPLVQIQAWLGHTNIAQTSTYLGISSPEQRTPCDGSKRRRGLHIICTNPQSRRNSPNLTIELNSL